MTKKAYDKCPDCGSKTKQSHFKLFEDDCYCEKCNKSFATAPLSKEGFIRKIAQIKEQ